MSSSFVGFSTQRDRAVALPIELFTQVLAEVRELAELKVLLAVFRLLASRPAPKGKPRAVSWEELRQDPDLREGLAILGREQTLEERLDRAVEQAVARGTLLHLVVQRGGHAENWYVVNTADNRQLLADIQERPAEILTDTPLEGAEVRIEQPTIYALYEQNIGMITPMLADELAEAEKRYPSGWIEDAFREAVAYNKRSWRYVEAILKRWEQEGRGERAGREIDIEDYKRGEYADIFGENAE